MEEEKKGGGGGGEERGEVEEDKEEGVKGIPIEIWREGKIWKRGEEKRRKRMVLKYEEGRRGVERGRRRNKRYK